MDRSPGTRRRLTWSSGAATALALLACYGTFALVGILSVLGVAVRVPDGLWSAAIVLFAWLAFVTVLINFRQHRTPWLLIVGAAGASLISWAMLVSYNGLLEVAGFAALIGVAVGERRLARCRSAAAPDGRPESSSAPRVPA